MPVLGYPLERLARSIFVADDAIGLLVSQEFLHIARHLLAPHCGSLFVVGREHACLLIIKKHLVEGVVTRIVMTELELTVFMSGGLPGHIFTEDLSFVSEMVFVA